MLCDCRDLASASHTHLTHTASQPEQRSEGLRKPVVAHSAGGLERPMTGRWGEEGGLLALFSASICACAAPMRLAPRDYWKGDGHEAIYSLTRFSRPASAISSIDEATLLTAPPSRPGTASCLQELPDRGPVTASSPAQSSPVLCLIDDQDEAIGPWAVSGNALQYTSSSGASDPSPLEDGISCLPSPQK
jgi:hypothetical protein